MNYAAEAGVTIHGPAQNEWAGAKLQCEIKFSCSIVIVVGDLLNS